MRFLSVALLIASAAAGQTPLTWYMKETAMTPDGRLTFLEKAWWPKAKALLEGQQFTLDLNRDGRPDTLILRKNGDLIQAIDDSGKAANIWNEVSTAFLVSFKGTGLVDRMIVYLDNNGDRKSDEVELRHYQDGYLRYSWFGENYDPDGLRIFDLKGWNYAGNNGNNKFRGNLSIYLNKYDARGRGWTPLSECPFSFWDLNRDGHADAILRVSAAPLDSNQGPDADYANNYKYMWAETATSLEKMGNMNVRFSLNIDPPTRPEPLNQPHTNFGFNLVGAVPYSTYHEITYTNPRRRPPQTVRRIRWEDGQTIALTYPAKETGFTWDEARSVWRWEGQFWIFERIYMPNTGGPTHRWNMRREYSPKPAARRELYYSAADRRYHLYGAREGWLEAGHLVNQEKDLEFRWFDRDGDGLLDSIQVYEGDGAVPVRVGAFEPQARRVELDREAMAEEYNRIILPEAMAQNEKMIAALKQVAASPKAELWLAEAAKATMAERRRYCQDIARELLFLKAREVLLTRNASGPYPQVPIDRRKGRSLEPGTRESGYSMGDSLRYWARERLVQEFQDHYAAGRFEAAASSLASLQ